MITTTFWGRVMLSQSLPSIPSQKFHIFIYGLILSIFGISQDANGQSQTFTSNGTFIVPAGAVSLTVEAWGGGGRGAARNSGTGSASGGGGGAYARKTFAVNPGDSYAVNVGQGSSSTAAGGDSWFGSAALVLAKGGSTGANNTTAAVPGGLASASIGDVKYNGGSGAGAGGGGSSAGSGANGTNADSALGAFAPSEGGNGGTFLLGGAAVPGGGGSGGNRTVVLVFPVVTAPTNGANGQVRVSWTYAMPSFTEHPDAANLCEGADISLSAASEFTDSYQWTKDGIALDGETSSTLLLENVSTADAGTYAVIASNAYGSTSSNGAMITVTPSPIVTPGASSEVICDGDSVNLLANADLNSLSTLVLIDEDFNGATTSFTSINNSTGGSVADAAWTLRDPGYFILSPFSIFLSNDLSRFYLTNSAAQGGGATSTSLQSAGFNTMGMSTCAMTYYQNHQHQGDQTARVQVSTDGVNWTTLTTSTSTVGTSAGFVQTTVSLNGYVNQPMVYVRFRFDATNDNYWAIDNVIISGTMSASPVYSWTSDPAGFISSVENPLNVTPAGTTTYYLTTQNHLGCISEQGSVTITVNPNVTYYADSDGDGFGDIDAPQVSCMGAPTGYVANDTDCDDSNNAINQEFQFYVDDDGDGFGSGNLVDVCAVDANTPPTGYSISGTDCDDMNPFAYPGAIEIGYNLIDDDCDGLTDEGFPPKTTEVSATTCGTTLSSLDQMIYAGLVAGAQGYQWRVTTLTGPNAGQVQLLDTPLRQMKMTWLANYAFATTYKVEVAVYFGAGPWLQPYKISNCSITTPTVFTSVTGCGVPLTTIYDIVYAHNIPFATGYKFKVIDPVNPANTQEIIRPIREFRFDQITAFEIVYGKTYIIQVCVRNTDGTYLPYGPLCAVATPFFPTTSVGDSQCDDGFGFPYQVPSMNTPIYAESYPGVFAYVFRLTGAGLPLAGVEVTKPLRVFTLNDFNGMGLVPGQSYNVNVRLVFDPLAPIGSYGKTCTLTVPGGARMSETVFNADVYPNPYDETFDIAVSAEVRSQANVRVYDMTGRLIEHREAGNAADLLGFGQNYPAGVYNVILNHEGKLHTLRVIKR